jgi:hypothetical protein
VRSGIFGEQRFPTLLAQKTNSTMTTAALSLFTAAGSLLTLLFSKLFNAVLYLTLFYTFCSYMGWIRRFVTWFIEFKLSELWNGVTVTLGSLELQLIKGHAVIYNAIIHTPDREAWQWQSPLIVRVGRVEIEWNMLSVIYQFVYLGRDPPIIDVYSVHASDIQVFVERQQHVFNVYLLDPCIVLPDPADIVKTSVVNKDMSVDPPAGASDASSTEVKTDITQEDLDAEQQAQELVYQIFSTIKLIGKRGVSDAWKQQRATLTEKLRQLQSAPKKAESLQESVKVIQKVGKAVKNSSQIPITPQRRELENPPPTLYCRVGRVIIQNGRVFVRQNEEWNSRPIVVKEIVVRAAELSPPMSLTDEHGLPAIYQPIDNLVQVVWRRILAEMAKSQTGRFLNTAMGEMLGIAMTNMETSKAKNTKPFGRRANSDVGMTTAAASVASA